MRGELAKAMVLALVLAVALGVVVAFYEWWPDRTEGDERPGGVSGVVTAQAIPGAHTALDSSLAAVPGTLVDQSGHAWTLGELAGRPSVVSAIYTRCPTVFPTLFTHLKQLEEHAKPGDSLRFVLVSLDPAADTPARWQAYARLHALDAHWTLVTPSPGMLPSLLRVLGVGRTPDGGEITHTALICMTDRQGFVRERRAGLDADPGTLLAAWRALRRRT